MKAEFNESQKGKKIFILGATGFIGFAVALRLIDLGFKNIYCMYRDEGKKDQLFSGLSTSSITFLHGDVSQTEVLRRGLENAEIVFNASGAATDWGIKREIWGVNVEAPKAMVRMIEDMKASTHYIHVTSASVYGFSKALKTEDSPLVKKDRFYTASKVELHSWLRKEMKRDHSFPVTILAPTIVWGPGDRIYIPVLKERMKAKQLFYFGKARKVDFVHINDLVNAILRCFFNENAYNKEYIISGSEAFTFEEYICKIAEFAELPPPKFRLPLWLCMSMAFMMESLARLINLFRPSYRPMLTRLQVLLLAKPLNVSIAKAREELGYEPEIDFAEGLVGIKEYCRTCS